jgi:hypothetical protein
MTCTRPNSVAPSSPASRPTPSGWPPASLDPGSGRHNQTAVGSRSYKIKIPLSEVSSVSGDCLDYWLFPGGIPGKHLATENIRAQLAERGIQPRAARNAAMFQLAAEIPTPILADILGLGATTATSWAALASRDWSRYTAQRANLTPL